MTCPHCKTEAEKRNKIRRKDIFEVITNTLEPGFFVVSRSVMENVFGK